ncbi:uncharacterized protein M6B38_134415 [Iris pallida]|uniref:Uncharacterized protein n=1 Tax=Iris pallida TaxID=29817 RepID=A0AAX6FG34_IRIPA|nr:uncharacterized protein M6B38_134415 [Iris pallida]
MTETVLERARLVAAYRRTSGEASRHESRHDTIGAVHIHAKAGGARSAVIDGIQGRGIGGGSGRLCWWRCWRVAVVWWNDGCGRCSGHSKYEVGRR